MNSVFPVRQGACMITMGVGQWDLTLQEAYTAGWVLLELDDNERPVAAYQRQTN